MDGITEFGPTYGEKPVQLAELCERNEDLGDHLGAMVYLARLMHRRTDPMWSANPVPESRTPAVWALAVARDSSFSIQTHIDGSITAVSRDGDILSWELSPAVSSDEALAKTGLRREVLSSHTPACSRLVHDLESKYWMRYRHGPYARGIILVDVPRDPGTEISQHDDCRS